MPAPLIEGKPWDQFLSDFKRDWKPGQHVAIIAPTGQGKTTVLCSLLSLRNYVLALDPKGGDDTLPKTGFPRLSFWPPKGKDYDKMARGEPVRYIVGIEGRAKEKKLANRQLLAQVVPGAIENGGWTIAIDEFQLATDRRYFALAEEAEEGLISARKDKISIITLFQRPANVSRAAFEMASWIFLGLTLDVDTVNRLAEIVGRPRHEIRGAVEGLASHDFSWMCLPNNPRRPIVVTLPREAGR